MAVLVMISTQRDETACNAFKIKHEFWQKTMEVLINPYKATSEKPLGSYENVPQPKEQ